jgi:hypothetical protein
MAAAMDPVLGHSMDGGDIDGMHQLLNGAVDGKKVTSLVVWLIWMTKLSRSH